MGARLSVTGDKKVSRRFKDLAHAAEDVEKVWPKVGSYMSREVSRQFTTEGAHFGTPWQRLKPATILAKRRAGFRNKILQATGSMRKTWVGRPMNIEIYRGNSASFGSSDQKAVWHQYGTRRNGKRVNPPRPMLKVTNQMRKDVKQMIADHIMGRSK